jgi:hypothetical protein
VCSLAARAASARIPDHPATLGVSDKGVHCPERTTLRGARVPADAFRLTCDGRPARQGDAGEHNGERHALSHCPVTLLILPPRVKLSERKRIAGDDAL